MGDEHLSTILETESDKLIKSSFKNLVPVPSEYEVTFDTDSDCDVPANDESSPIFKTFSNPLFDYTLFDSSPKFDYLEEFSGELIPTRIINEERIKREHEEYISLIEKEEIDIFTGTDDLMPPGIKSDDYNSEGDIHFLEELLSNDSIPLFENESSKFDHHDDPSFPRPPPEPPDVEVFFEPDSGVLTTKVGKGISEQYVLMSNILPTLPTFDPLYPVYDTLLLFSLENEDKVFKHGFLSYLLVSHWDKITSDFFENPMMMYGGDIPLLDVPYIHFYPL
nr:hypothetical protein [Tanacetum cinerariifolium]